MAKKIVYKSNHYIIGRKRGLKGNQARINFDTFVFMQESIKIITMMVFAYVCEWSGQRVFLLELWYKFMWLYPHAVLFTQHQIKFLNKVLV